MNILEMTDAQIYEHGIKVLTECLGLSGTTRFLQICQPHQDEVSQTEQKLSALEMEEIHKKV